MQVGEPGSVTPSKNRSFGRRGSTWPWGRVVTLIAALIASVVHFYVAILFSDGPPPCAPGFSTERYSLCSWLPQLRFWPSGLDDGPLFWRSFTWSVSLLSRPSSFTCLAA